MSNKNHLRKLIRYIEENLRASRTSGFEFIDPRNHRDRLVANQNHIIFGRRGAGKSTLITSLDNISEIILVTIDLEDFKDITFPNIILQILVSSLEKIRNSIGDHNPWYRFILEARKLRSQIQNEIDEIKSKVLEPDIDERNIRTTTRQSTSGGFGAGSDAAKAQLEARKEHEVEVSGEISISKLDYLLHNLTIYKDLINQASILCGSKPIFLSLDDYYFAKKAIQPNLVDYFHRLTKDTNLYLKIATIKNRSFLYKRSEDTYIGIEIGHDIFEIDLDYTLDNFADLKGFMDQLLISANKRSNANIDISDLFSGEGFIQLCLASGGVPRDFLSLFVQLVTDTVLPRNERIGKVEVTEAAIANIHSKRDALRLDSGVEGIFLEEYLSVIRTRVYSDRRTNVFLVAKPELENHPQSRQAIRELVDLRLIHVVDNNTSSAPSDGRRYEAYIIDVGLYENSRPRNFTQIMPGTADEKSRRDAIRAAPRIQLSEIENILSDQGLQLELFTIDN